MQSLAMAGLGPGMETQQRPHFFLFLQAVFLLKVLSFLTKLLRGGFPLKFTSKGNDPLPLDLRALNWSFEYFMIKKEAWVDFNQSGTEFSGANWSRGQAMSCQTVRSNSS